MMSEIHPDVSCIRALEIKDQGYGPIVPLAVKLHNNDSESRKCFRHAPLNGHWSRRHCTAESLHFDPERLWEAAVCLTAVIEPVAVRYIDH